MKTPSWTLLKFVVVLALVDSTESTWWYLSQLNITRSTSPRIYCDFIPKGDKVQRRICEKSSQVMLSMVNGVKAAITECQHQFRYAKWNCEVHNGDKLLFGKRLLRGGTRELAFFQGSVSAISTLAVAKDCSSGMLACGCSSSHNKDHYEGSSVTSKFKWDDCVESIKFALNSVRRFTDSSKSRDTTTKAMLHNNRAGRMIFEDESQLLCKCHGVSGSCTLKTCWRGLPNIRALGHALRGKYDGAIKIKIDPAGRLVPVDRLQRKPGKRNLVYFEDSPDFCHWNSSSKAALLGTDDRPCNMASDGEDSCEMLCCGRGWNSISKKVSFLCNCRFLWCCEVKCETCQEVRVESRCKARTSALLSPIQQPSLKTSRINYLLSHVSGYTKPGRLGSSS